MKSGIPHVRCLLIGDRLTINGQSMNQSNFIRYYYADKMFDKIFQDRNRMIPDTLTTTYPFDGRDCLLTISLSEMWDEYPNLRYLSYLDIQCFIMFFSYENITILNSIEKKWYPEVKQHAPNATIYLVGVHGSIEREHVTSEQINALALKLNMVFWECSLGGNEIYSIFQQIFRHVFKHHFVSRYPFFSDHFSSSKLGLQFSNQVAVIARSHLQENSCFGRLPSDILFSIFLELGKQLLVVPACREHQLALMALCQLIYANVNSKSLIGRQMIWNRTLIVKNKEPVPIYPQLKSRTCNLL